MQKLTVIKIGGNIVDDERALKDFLDAFAQLNSPKILVHGGGKLATKLATELAIPTAMVEGRRITSEAMLPLTVMVYAGLINKQLVAQLQQRHCDALGVSGADAQLIKSHKRPIAPIDYGFVGDFSPQDVHHTRLKQLLEIGLCPVFSAITANQEGQLLNTNADTIASNLAIALATDYQVELVYCFEHAGVLRDIKDKNSVIPSIHPSNFDQLKEEGIISEGMLPKIANALAAVEQKVHRVCIKSAQELLIQTAGTIISQ
ncbi:acetylglutamate kinase [Myroides sp. 1354]|uniref:acetylglutamate kinase n=1 Tax=unclassified Myroides TaxID=2642485 RepID=UPI0025783ACD|nr:MULTISPECIES: acetylglutamate kinase [unclassified Myroides]MDM1043736.1 acetylglutamate kinase [Myroides sp. R163-1]MDM1054214.1 acetylglutamate kinase [Myroides sp. 1354]MDM1067510.1 acetylglutamate kinase [Myroides sp. 1372]